MFKVATVMRHPTAPCTRTPLARPEPERDLDARSVPPLVSLPTPASGAAERERWAA
jgi:hypothetical protein